MQILELSVVNTPQVEFRIQDDKNVAYMYSTAWFEELTENLKLYSLYTIGGVN
jgi:hypothetical protein